MDMGVCLLKPAPGEDTMETLRRPQRAPRHRSHREKADYRGRVGWWWEGGSQVTPGARTRMGLDP